MSLLFFCATLIYAGLIATVIIALLRQKNPSNKEIQGISVIVAARNEAENLPRLLKSFAALEYPLWEAIIVNDHSTDSSMDILSVWEGKHNIRVLDFQGEREGLIGKKAALQIGIEAAQYDVLAFTDADCSVPKTWLSTINSALDTETDYLIGYSIIKPKEESSELRLQNFERGVYYALAAAGLYWRKPITSSACNMVYRKSLFQRAGGFKGIGHLRSGDDDLLLMKMMPFIRKAIFLPDKSMQVVSISGKDIKQTHQTNIRRASKFRYFPLLLQALALYIFGYFALFYYELISLFWLMDKWLPISALLIKTSAELGLILLHFRRIGHLKLSALYPVQILLFPLQFVFYALRGTFGSYRWK